ncbi:hypothetical protein G7Y89_g14031 [Cudoniella acicularis]|uniref:F-box domain-containing protein n=1 Tax=Cudoniella acicularis TaxID=354080 RepID=A0A8H4R737_9HELO|nr:hypothetical protein G7Y89_g14031 [Cudoniella acicularis]
MSSVSEATSQKSRLITLPNELQDSITVYLSTPDILSLRLTNTHFHTTIPPPTHQQLLTTEKNTLGGIPQIVFMHGLRPSPT